MAEHGSHIVPEAPLGHKDYLALLDGLQPFGSNGTPFA
jgi:hypothetical protein